MRHVLSVKVRVGCVCSSYKYSKYIKFMVDSYYVLMRLKSLELVYGIATRESIFD